MEFIYTNKRPPAARPGLNTNRIRLWWEGETLKYERRYVSSDGNVSETGIQHTFGDTPENPITPENVAKMIHWGCCGWAAGIHEIWMLRDIVALFIASRHSY